MVLIERRVGSTIETTVLHSRLERGGQMGDARQDVDPPNSKLWAEVCQAMSAYSG